MWGGDWDEGLLFQRLSVGSGTQCFPSSGAVRAAKRVLGAEHHPPEYLAVGAVMLAEILV